MENIDAHTEPPAATATTATTAASASTAPNPATTADNAASANDAPAPTGTAASAARNTMANIGVSPAEKARARKLSALNTSFYAEVAASFSETRRTKWHGWDILADFLEDAAPSAASAFSVLDMACGNMRFEKYLQARFPKRRFSFNAVDNCLPLAEEARMGGIGFYERDVIGLLADDALSLMPRAAHGEPTCDLSVCFGFFHHVPLFEMRVSLLRKLIDALDGGGTCCVSLWRFLDDARIAKKAHASTERALELGIVQPADLHAGDYLLGWEKRDDVFRYCHYFDDAEIMRTC